MDGTQLEGPRDLATLVAWARHPSDRQRPKEQATA
jgi:hypothetical protein